MQILYKNYRSKRRFGVEIEVGKNVPKKDIIECIHESSNIGVRGVRGYTRSNNNRTWHVKPDNSCGEWRGEGGWEIASFVGRCHQDILHIGEIAEAIKARGAAVNDNCGLHIHVEVTDFTPSQIGVLIGYWLKIEGILRYAISTSRKLDYCLPLESTMLDTYGPRYFYQYRKPLELYTLFSPPEDEDNPWDYRYYALNIVNYWLCEKDKRRKRKTVELRLPESSLDAANVINWTRLFVNFVEYVKDKPMPLDLVPALPSITDGLRLMGLNHDKPNFYIFSPGLAETRRWLLRLITSLPRHPHGDNKQEILQANAKNLLNKLKL